MELARNIMLAVTSAALLALAGCSSTRTTPTSSSNALARSADALDRSARVLADESDTMNPALQDDAHRLAASAFQFHHDVGLDGTDNSSTRSAFESVSRTYQQVKQDVDHLGNADARADLQPVTEAYQDAEHALR
jgi:ABC-type Fe3+-hydroxamate transport system substrate-binding protein